MNSQLIAAAPGWMAVYSKNSESVWPFELRRAVAAWSVEASGEVHGLVALEDAVGLALAPAASEDGEHFVCYEVVPAMVPAPPGWWARREGRLYGVALWGPAVGTGLHVQLVPVGHDVWVDDALGRYDVDELFYAVEQPAPEGGPLPSKAAAPQHARDFPIEELGLPARTYNCLKRSNITTVGQVLAMSDEDLLAVRYFGLTNLDEVHDRLRSLDLRLEQMSHSKAK